MKEEIYIKKIIDDTGLSIQEINELVNEKVNELKGLISKEGALFILAKEFGVDLNAKETFEELERSGPIVKEIIDDTGLSIQEINELVNEKTNELKGLISVESALFILAKELGVNIQSQEELDYLDPYLSIVNKIIKDTGLTRKEINVLVKEKIDELEGIISKFGATYIIANELGVELSSEFERYNLDLSGSLLNEIIERTKLSELDIQVLVRERMYDLKGLISVEGALFIIAKEFGVDKAANDKSKEKVIIAPKEEIRKRSLKGPTLVFCSYATADSKSFNIKKIASNLAKFERIQEVLYWEENMTDNIYQFMSDALGKSDVMLLFCSTNANNSIPVNKEWTAADSMDIPIIPIFEDKKQIPPLLRSRLGLVFNRNNIEDTIKKIYDLIVKKLSKEL